MRLSRRAAAAVTALWADAPALAAQPSTYTLSAEQKATLAEALKAATCWYAAQGPADTYAYGLAQRETIALMRALAAQDLARREDAALIQSLTAQNAAPK